METDQRRCPAPASPTAGPNRLTIWVPSETTYLNLGQAFPSFHERGIDGHTDRHVHFYTPKTTVMMGKDCQILPGHVGYSMVTHDYSYQHADEQHCFVSKTNQVALRTAGPKGNAVLQSDRGTTEVAAGKSVVINAENSVHITAGCGYSPCTNTYDQSWVNATRDGGITAHLSAASTCIYCTQVAATNVAEFVSSVIECKYGDAHWAPTRMLATPKAAASVGNIAACIASLGVSPDSIRMTADFGVCFGGGKSIMFGEILSCRNTMGGASIVGTTAELKAWTLATVWGGLTATMSSKNKCKISSTLGKTLFSAKANASFASDDEMLVFGNKEASLRAGGTAALYGGKQAYVGAKPFGLVAKGDSVAFGKVGNGEKFDAPALDAKHALTVKEGSVQARRGDDAMLYVIGDRKTVILKQDNDNLVRVSDKGVVVKGKEIHIE